MGSVLQCKCSGELGNKSETERKGEKAGRNEKLCESGENDTKRSGEQERRGRNELKERVRTSERKWFGSAWKREGRTSECIFKVVNVLLKKQQIRLYRGRKEMFLASKIFLKNSNLTPNTS